MNSMSISSRKESFLGLYDERGEMVGVVRFNEKTRYKVFYRVEEMGMDDIEGLFDGNSVAGKSPNALNLS